MQLLVQNFQQAQLYDLKQNKKDNKTNQKISFTFMLKVP